MVTWIMVAHRAGARLFRSRGPGAPLDLIMTIPHPEGRALDRELGTDKPGRLFKIGSGGRADVGQDTGGTDQIANRFASDLAGILEEGRTHQSFDNLILVAEPKFLGKLRNAITHQTMLKVIATLGKDLGNLPERELPRHLGELMDVWQAAMLPTGS